MRHIAIFAILLLFIVPAHADVGPSPAAPDVSVSMQKSDGTPDLQVTVLTYHCMGSNSTSDGAVDARLADLPCASGTCKNNGGWFYKFNPCYDFPEGYFSYELGGKEIDTGYFNNTQAASSYDIVVDSESGKIKSINGSSPVIPPSCIPAFLLAGVVGAALFAGKE